MSWKFNTKKFIKDVLNDRYALVIGNEIILDTKIEPSKHQRSAMQSAVEMFSDEPFSPEPSHCLSREYHQNKSLYNISY